MISEIDAMKVIAERLESLSEEERGRVLAWAQSKYGTGTTSNAPLAIQHAPPAAPPAAGSKSAGAAGKKASSKAKGVKKAKSVISMDKNLNLAPSGKLSAVDFATKKAPPNAMQKCVVAVYYLRDVIEVSAVTTQGVYTFFKTLGWPVPTDLRNTLQKSGSEGWLDTADGDDIKLTSMGENLVEHSLPPKSKA